MTRILAIGIVLLTLCSIPAHAQNAAMQRYAICQNQTQTPIPGHLRQTLADVCDAVDRAEAAIVHFNRDQHPVLWADLEDDLGNALHSLGVHGDRQALLDAAAAFRAAQQINTPKSAFMHWSADQINLANVLRRLANDDASMREAVEAARVARDTIPRTPQRILWANAQLTYGYAQVAAGRRACDRDALREAAAAFEATTDVYARATNRTVWLGVEDERGRAFAVLAECGDEAARGRAIEAFRGSLAAWRPGDDTLEKARAQTDLAAMLASGDSAARMETAELLDAALPVLQAQQASDDVARAEDIKARLAAPAPGSRPS